MGGGPRGGGPTPGIGGGPRSGGDYTHWNGGRHHGNPPGANQRPAPGIRSFPQPGQPPNTFGSVHGYGNVVFPGTGHAPGTFSPFSVVDPTFGSRLAGTVSGFGYPYNYGYSPRTSVPYVVPYYVPVYVPEPVLVAPAPVAPTQIIYIVPGAPERNLTTTAPPSSGNSVITYVVPSREPPPAADAPQKLYLIAFKNHSIYSATEYWLEGDTLHYLTSYGAHNQVSLDQVDLEFTTRLNRERGIEFKLERQQ